MVSANCRHPDFDSNAFTKGAMLSNLFILGIACEFFEAGSMIG